MFRHAHRLVQKVADEDLERASRGDIHDPFSPKREVAVNGFRGDEDFPLGHRCDGYSFR